MNTINKSFSASNVSEMGNESTPFNFASLRSKRMRDEDLPAELDKFKDEMRELLNSFMLTQQNQLMGITANLKEIQHTNQNIDSSIALLTSQNEEFRKKIEVLECQSKKDREYIVILENKIEDLQRTSRKTSVEIKNVPKKERENTSDLINMVTCLAKNVNLELQPRDIRDIFRLQTKTADGNRRNMPIIVELGSTIMKTDFLKKIKLFNMKNKCKLQVKHLGYTTQEDTAVFVSEQLTPKGARLFFLARDLVKLNKFKYCWTSFGKVLVRKDDQSRIIHISNEAQIHLLLQDA